MHLSQDRQAPAFDRQHPRKPALSQPRFRSAARMIVRSRDKGARFGLRKEPGVAKVSLARRAFCFSR
jgi:hypothetical protein